MWPEISIVIKERRHELLIADKKLENKLDETNGSLDKEIWQLKDINFLSLTGSSLSHISDSLENLSNLTNLVLQGNKLSALPETINKLTKLKLLNVSENKLESLPNSICKLSSLSTLNARSNEILTLPKFSGCSSLAHVDFAHNCLSEFEKLCDASLTLLADINLSHNKIVDVSSDVNNLPSLKLIDLSNNKIKEVPCEFGQCSKLKELNLKSNTLVDFKLRKIVESDRSLPKHVIDYMKLCKKSSKKNKGSSKQKETNEEEEQEADEVEFLADRLSVLSCKNDITITATNGVLAVRSYLVCCILRNLDLVGINLKKFINIQTKLHEGECQRRVAATIATHDLNKVKGPLIYTSKPPKEIVFIPLNGKKETDAVTYYRKLLKEAEFMRKQNKRNVSGLHKYLHLVDSMPTWPCLIDCNGKVISMPPITNAESTKIDNATTDVLIEVTSGASLKKAKEVMEALVTASLQDGLGMKQDNFSILTIEQVKVVGEDGALRVLYPSRTDLVFDESQIKVVRE